MDIATAQYEIRRAYLRGGPGAVISGLVWLTSGTVAAARGTAVGFAVLFLGGMLIFPIASVIVRGVFGRERVSRANPGGLTVIETIVPMIGGFLAAWLFLPHRPDWVFPLSAIAVGAHYFGFRTAYGDWTNWGLGGILCAAGIGAIFFGVPAASSLPFVIAVVEIVFGAWFIGVSLSKEKQPVSAGPDDRAGG